MDPSDSQEEEVLDLSDQNPILNPVLADPRMRCGFYYYWMACREDKIKHPALWDLPLAIFLETCEENYVRMNDKQREPFVKQARAFNKQYEPKKRKATRNANEGGRKKNTKDPNEPKRPPNAFILFSKAMRRTAKAKYPGYNSTKMLGDMWAKCDRGTRKHFTALAEKEKERFKREMEEYKKRQRTSVGATHPPQSDGDEESEMESDEEDVE